MEYNNAVKFLKNSMIYQMSLGSKELFHSNVWWWLIDNDKNFIKVFIPDFDPAKYNNGVNIWARREELDRDILIWLEDDKNNKYHIVIENKIKTLPTIEQLCRYTTNINQSLFKNGILTGIGNCSLNLNDIIYKNGVSGSWSYVNYTEIANRIHEIANKSKSNVIINHLNQIEEYCDIILCLNLILEENINKYKNVFTYDCDKDILKELRISDVFKKHKCSQFFNYIINRKEELEVLKPNGYNLNISQGFHNNRATLDVRFSNYVDYSINYKLLGVQIEGDQFRIVAERNAQFSTDSIYSELNYNWFDDSYDKDTNRFIFNNSTSMKPRNNKKYDSYNTKDYNFVYQYFDISKLGNKNYESIFEMIKHYMFKATKLLK